MVHGPQVAERCVFQSAVLYPAKAAGEAKYNVSSVIGAFSGDEMILKQIRRDDFMGQPLLRLLKHVGLDSYGIPSKHTHTHHIRKPLLLLRLLLFGKTVS
jgi:hypothetical protein